MPGEWRANIATLQLLYTVCISRSKMNIMSAADVIAEVNRCKPLLPPSPILDSIKYIHNGLEGWNESGDVNAQLREEVVSALYKDYSDDHKAIIRFLTNAEIQYCREETMMTEVLRQLSFMLYDLADMEDVPLLFETKMNTSFDSLCSVDIELLIGKDPQKVKEHFLINRHPVYDIAQYIIEHEEDDELEAPSSYIAAMKRRYIV